MKSLMSLCLFGFVLIGTGCRSTPKPGVDLASNLAAAEIPTTEWRPITFVDDPKLRESTGPMDVESAPDFSKTDSGLQYRILRSSNGPKPTASSTVSVNYRGWLGGGKVFDSSYENGQPTTFPLNGVIAGWTEGMQLVGEGGMIELWVPSRLGYGAAGSPGSIPAHSDLHFIVELEDVR